MHSRICEYFEQLHTQKLDNLDEISQFLKNYKLPQFFQYEIDNLNSPIIIKKIEFIYKNHPKKKSSSPCSFIKES